MAVSGSIRNIGAKGADYSTQPAPPAPGNIDPVQAAQGTSASDNGKSCGTGAGPGVKGLQGKPGVAGTKGGDGKPGGQIKVNAGQMDGDYTYIAQGGDGGGGQTGGPGGVGQIGGPGGASSSHCDGGAQGAGGPGGIGGAGGDAGAGGDTGDIYITYTSGNPKFTITIQAGNPGLAANPGQGGNGGQGNPTPGQADPGAHGKTASGGKNGQIFVNGKPQPPS